MGKLKPYRVSIQAMVIYALLLLYPTILQIINTAPTRNQLRHFSGKITFIQNSSPNFMAETPDGEMKIDLPGRLFTLIRGKNSYYKLSKSEIGILNGCDAEFLVDDVKGMVVFDYPRAWEIRCGDFLLPYEKQIYLKSKSQDVPSMFLLNGAYIFFVVLIFLLERKSKWASQSMV